MCDFTKLGVCGVCINYRYPPTVVPMPSNELKADFFGLSSSSSNVASSTNVNSFLPPPPDLENYTLSLSYGHMPPPLSSLRQNVHYPSQDRSRVGSIASHGKTN